MAEKRARASLGGALGEWEEWGSGGERSAPSPLDPAFGGGGGRRPLRLRLLLLPPAALRAAAPPPGRE